MHEYHICLLVIPLLPVQEGRRNSRDRSPPIGVHLHKAPPPGTKAPPGEALTLVYKRKDTPYRHEMVCSLQQEQCDAATLQQTDYLNFTSQHLVQVKQKHRGGCVPSDLKTVMFGG